MEKINTLSKISSPRVKKLAARIVYRNYPERTITYQDFDYETHFSKIFSNRQDEKIIGFRNDIKLDRENAKALLEDSIQDNDLDEEQKKIAHLLKQYLDSMENL